MPRAAATRANRTPKGEGATLTERVEQALEQRIRRGAVKPGDKLPTAEALIDAFGVSRTVVREAVARLQARGLVEARHGAGVFVLDAAKGAGVGRVAADAAKLANVLDVLEIRLAVEIEAAALAAARRTPSQEIRIREACQAFAAALKRGDLAAEADFAFHRAVAEATNNAIFVDFLDGLGKRSIPRAQLGPERRPDIAYLQKVHQEHQAVMAAISGGNAEAARRAMRRHLQESQARYRSLLPA